MKIYFEDGRLDPRICRNAVHIDAAGGVYHCKQMLDYFSDAKIYTNSPLALTGEFNKE